MKNEKEIRNFLTYMRENHLFYDNSMSTENGRVSENLCRVLEWVLDASHDYQGYTQPDHKVPKLMDIEFGYTRTRNER